MEIHRGLHAYVLYNLLVLQRDAVEVLPTDSRDGNLDHDTHRIQDANMFLSCNAILGRYLSHGGDTFEGVASNGLFFGNLPVLYAAYSEGKDTLACSEKTGPRDVEDQLTL